MDTVRNRGEKKKKFKKPIFLESMSLSYHNLYQQIYESRQNNSDDHFLKNYRNIIKREKLKISMCMIKKKNKE